MTATTLETTTRKPHGFSIESLIGHTDSRADDRYKSVTNRPPPSPARVEKSTSPESENRCHTWTGDDLKHFFGNLTTPSHPSPADVSALYPPLRVCNRVLSTGNTSAFLPHHLSALPFNPLVYGLGRDIPHNPHPLLAARYPGLIHPRYHVGPPPGLLFHPYRKPKRNRTAFSPSQLLQLEQAFEKNHYVVGQERKELASKLQLSETQVKVWFQNRRTKHKRMKAEEEASERGSGEVGKGEPEQEQDGCNQKEIETGSDVSDVDEDHSSEIGEEEEEEELTVADLEEP